MQITTHSIPAGTQVQTPSGRRAVTVDDTTIVKNSETGFVTGTNMIRFSADDEVCPGGEWLWNTGGLTPIPTYTLAFETKDGPQTRERRTDSQIETLGAVVNKQADRGEVWNIAVLDTDGTDITGRFACFQD